MKMVFAANVRYTRIINNFNSMPLKQNIFQFFQSMACTSNNFKVHINLMKPA
jgi:hypothetical protein